MEKRFEWNYIIIPVITIVTWLSNRFMIQDNLEWYHASVNIPFFAPPKTLITIAWIIIYILSTIAALLVWNTFERSMRFWLIISLFLTNAFLNFLFCYLFFQQHITGLQSVLGAGFLALTTYLLIFLSWPESRMVASLLIPYALWTTYATVVMIGVWMIN